VYHCRYQLLRGRRVHYVPGWDCHGLPIELKALAEARAELEKEDGRGDGEKKEKGDTGGGGAEEDALLCERMPVMEVRRRARQCAEAAIASQLSDFQRWGVMADWPVAANAAGAAVAANVSGSEAGSEAGSAADTVYTTMNPRYEAAQMGVFGEMLEAGVIYRAFKPVYWSPSTRTALAEAELEYVDDHRSSAAYISFPFVSLKGTEAAEKLGPLLGEDGGQGGGLSAVIWTTTPWTIPANMALSVAPDVEYSVVRTGNGRTLLLATELLGTLASPLLDRCAPEEVDGEGGGVGEGVPSYTVLCTISGAALEGSACVHPLTGSMSSSSSSSSSSNTRRLSPILCGDHVTIDAGTGIVHTAPGHGHDDFSVWQAADKAGLLRQVLGDADESAEVEEATRFQAAVVCPVDNAGCFTAAANMASGGVDLEGISVLGEGSSVVLDILRERGALLAVDVYKHRCVCHSAFRLAICGCLHGVCLNFVLQIECSP
jgi:isoleucyl-tRNA synthetase